MLNGKIWNHCDRALWCLHNKPKKDDATVIKKKWALPSVSHLGGSSMLTWLTSASKNDHTAWLQLLFHRQQVKAIYVFIFPPFHSYDDKSSGSLRCRLYGHLLWAWLCQSTAIWAVEHYNTHQPSKTSVQQSHSQPNTIQQSVRWCESSSAVNVCRKRQLCRVNCGATVCQKEARRHGMGPSVDRKVLWFSVEQGKKHPQALVTHCPTLD